MEFALNLIFSLFRGATPLIFASLGGLISERSGVIQIGLEGMMTMGALFGAIVGLYFDSAWMGFLAGTFAGMMTALIFAFFTVKLKTDQIIVGTAINILAIGLAPFTLKIIYDSTGSSPQLPIESRFTFEPMLMSLVAFAIVAYLYSKTKAGLLMRFSGEKPEAVLSAGYSVEKIKIFSLLGTGALAGMGGASLSLFLASQFSANMTAGRGFIALAALILGQWKPIPTVLACFFFASIDTLQIIFQYLELPIPGQLMQAIPYVITIIAVAGFFGSAKAPQALGKNIPETR